MERNIPWLNGYDEDDKFHINQNIAKLSPKDGVHPNYILYYLLSHIVKYQINFYNTSDAQPSVLVGNLRKFMVPIPQIKEQFQIAEKIEKKIKQIDSAMISGEKEIGLMEEYRTAIINGVVTGKIDVRDEV